VCVVLWFFVLFFFLYCGFGGFCLCELFFFWFFKCFFFGVLIGFFGFALFCFGFLLFGLGKRPVFFVFLGVLLRDVGCLRWYCFLWVFYFLITLFLCVFCCLG